MGLLKSKVSEQTEHDKLLQRLGLNENDLEFLLLAIKNAMISGSVLDQAVSTITKLQNMYTALQNSKKKKKS
tara:strand:- start:1560 stop:1775 length:216 start_codon:yes stop_codon:yes gene_type:complete